MRAAAVAAALAAVGCTAPEPAASSPPQNDRVGTETAGAVAPEDNRFASPHPPPADTKAGDSGQAAAAALCRITYGDETKAKAALKLQGKIGDVSLYAEPGGLLCSEPAGLKGDCQVVRGKTVIVAQAGKPDARIEALTAAPYMNYGPDGVRCAPPPPPVR